MNRFAIVSFDVVATNFANWFRNLMSNNGYCMRSVAHDIVVFNEKLITASLDAKKIATKSIACYLVDNLLVCVCVWESE